MPSNSVRATADPIMLEPNGRRVPEIIGKNPTTPMASSPQSRSRPPSPRWRRRCVLTDARTAPADDEEGADDEGQGTQRDPVSLCQRAAPSSTLLLRRSAAEAHDVVW